MAAVFVAASDSHRRAQQDVDKVSQLVDTALEEVKLLIYESNVEEFERLNPGHLHPFRNGPPARPYASASAFNDPGGSCTNVAPGILTFNGGSERVVRLGAFIPPSLLGDGNIVFDRKRKVSVSVNCRIPWRVFAGDARVEISVDDAAPMNDEFVRRLTAKLAEQNVEFSVDETDVQ